MVQVLTLDIHAHFQKRFKGRWTHQHLSDNFAWHKANGGGLPPETQPGTMNGKKERAKRTEKPAEGRLTWNDFQVPALSEASI
jgi:hypothetical protein